MFKALTAGMNMRRVMIGIVAMFVYVWVTDFIIHGMILGPMYQATQSLWRTRTEMQMHFGWMLFGQFVIAKSLMLIYAKGYQNKGPWEGFRFGLFMAPLMVAPNFVMYAVAPWPMKLVLSWVAFGFIQAIGAGLVAHSVYSKK